MDLKLVTHREDEMTVLNVMIFALVLNFIFTFPTSTAHQCTTIPAGYKSGIQRQGAVKLHYVRRQGPGETIVFIHGWPQNWEEWIEVMVLMPKQYDLIAVDLRGIGLSEKPTTGYEKKTMAKDVHALMNDLGIGKAHIVGHDIGGMVGYAIASQFPGRVSTFTIIDVPIPGTPSFEAISRNPLAWHFQFHSAPEVPEALTTGREAYYYGEFIRKLEGSPGAVTADQVDTTIRVYSVPKTATAGFNFYRAFPQDAKDNQEFFKRKLRMPVLALNSARLSPLPFVLQMMRQLAVDVRGQGIDSGHWIPDEKPEEVVRLLLKLIEN